MSETENNLFEIGKVLDSKWVIIEFVGKGAMGEVYRAHQLNLKRDVAIKVLSSEALQEVADDPDESGDIHRRFHREVQAMAKVRHSNVLNIYDYGYIDADPEASDGTSIDYIVMEYIPGNTLRFTMSDYGVGDDPDLYSNWIQTYFLPILDGVESIHSHNIVHRDLKPENVFIDADIPKIADFGLARSSTMKAITSSVTMLGTLAYMSPEQCSDFRKSDYKADIYALGKILFEAADGKLTQKTVPFKSVTLKDPETPFMKEVALVIEKATAEDQEDRFENVTELKANLKKALALHANGHPQNVQNGTTSAPRSNFHHKLIRVGIVFAILFSTATIGWHFMKKPGDTFEDNGSPAGHVQQGPLSPGNTDGDQSLGTTTGSIVAEHIGKQQLIRGGEINLPTTLESVAGKKVDIPAFYMDEFLVTNQQFVDFLNHNSSRITIEHGIVKGGGANWYLLGEIYEGYEPIVFREAEFHISDPGYASSPVLRVTGYGAAAFASSVNRRLPTELEWLYVTSGETDTQTPIENEKIPDMTKTSEMENMMNRGDNWGWQKEGWYPSLVGTTENETAQTISPPSHEPPSSAYFQQNNFKIRALNKGIGEWGIRTVSRPNENSLQDNVFLVMGGIDAQVKTDNTAPHMISRFPWEGFEEVGFRTVATSDN